MGTWRATWWKKEKATYGVILYHNLARYSNILLFYFLFIVIIIIIIDRWLSYGRTN